VVYSNSWSDIKQLSDWAMNFPEEIVKPSEHYNQWIEDASAIQINDTIIHGDSMRQIEFLYQPPDSSDGVTGARQCYFFSKRDSTFKGALSEIFAFGDVQRISIDSIERSNFNLDEVFQRCHGIVDSALMTYEVRNANKPRSRDSFELPQIGSYLPPDLLHRLSNMVPLQHDSALYLLDFWYLACGPCRVAMRFMGELYREFRQRGLQIVGVNPQDDDRVRIQQVFDKARVEYPTLVASDSVAHLMNIKAFPTLILVNKSGEVLWTHSGFANTKEFRDSLRSEIMLRLPNQD
jgi:thiol-disulfide isomerase/thioredoxin